MRLPADWAGAFEIVSCAAGTLVLASGEREALLHAGLDRPETWSAPEGASNRAGRGPTRRVELTAGVALLLKQMRRGGFLAPLWRDRFLGTQRLLTNLWVPHEARRRGVSTPRTLALRVVEGPPGLHRAWLAVEMVDGGVDLAARLTADPSLARAPIANVARTIRRMHDRGVEHPDLNLGNLIVRESEAGSECFVIDLDRARLRERPLSSARRERALNRLERSTHKVLGDSERAAEIVRLWYACYAENDPELLLRLEKARRRNRLRLRLHRLGWRR